MRLININISIKINNSREVAKLLVEENGDIVSIQEIIRHLNDKVFNQYQSKTDIEAELDNNYPYKFFAPLWISDAIRHDDKIHRDFGGQVEQGNEIISKYPIVDGANEFFYKHFSYAFDWTNWKNNDHGRAVQIAELIVGGKRLQILNLHGIWTADKQGDARTVSECKYIIQAAKRKDIATIIVGDFNLVPDTDSIKLINKQFRNLIDEYKIVSTRPDFDDGRDSGNMVVDYIFVNDKIIVNDFKVINANISDHLPLVLDFEIKS